MKINIKNIKSIHFVGIKGVAMTALALVAKEKGMRVSGSDIEEIFPTDATLRRFGISPLKKFSPQNIPPETDLVVYTGAHQGIHNPEVQHAVRMNIPVLPQGIALGLFMEGQRAVTVAGSHGKTTTSAMIAHILTQTGADPSFAVGCGEILSLKTSGHAGNGGFFVAEGDEYATDPTNDLTPRFMWQKPEILVVTNIDFDHPDIYPDLVSVQKTFVKYINGLPHQSLVIVNADDDKTAEIIPQIKRHITTFGSSETATFRFTNITFREAATGFSVYNENTCLGEFILKVPGRHNVANATAAVAALTHLGISREKIRSGLATFSGTKRRFELISNKNNILFYDDYAHHPAEIAATLRAARDWYPEKRIIVVFQPHTYSRTKVLLHEFAVCFTVADKVLITAIYASSREKPLPGISGDILFRAVKEFNSDAYFTPQLTDVLQYLRSEVRPNDLILTMGAGSIFTWLSEIRSTLE